MPQLPSPSLRPPTWSLAIATVVPLPVAAWWVIGDLTDGSLRAQGDPLDHAFKPPPLSGRVELAVGVAAAATVLACTVVLGIRARRSEEDRLWLGPLLAAALAAVIIGFGWRVATAGVIGANIGAGLVVMFGGPLVLVLLSWATVRSVALMRQKPISTQ